VYAAICFGIGIFAGIVAITRSARQYRRKWMADMYDYQYGRELAARGIEDPCAEKDEG
jgi:ABC-type phosphate/phosphonate transport system permease subunit